MSWVRLLGGGLPLAALLVLGFEGAGPLPPTGQLLDPWNGVWAAARSADLPPDAAARIPGLRDTVRVVYDDRAVPHVFARSAGDAYRALGYVVARDRLFQLDVQTRATAGTLAELLGSRALPIDRAQRALGLAWSAEQQWRALDSTSALGRAARAYADGVNAWIDGLTATRYPLEYHLLGARPVPWRPQYTFYLMQRMGQTLAFNNVERTRLRVARLVGDAAADALFPLHTPIQQPIQPGPGPYPRFDLQPLPPPAPPTSSAGERGAPPAYARLGSNALALGRMDERREDAVGSNNWAVAPGRSATGRALLAGDPHLDLSLPSIWYEAHLVAPALDVYGVTIPAVPGIVIGFNRDVAWSFTNTENDVLDLYEETLDDPVHPTAYRLDGAWRRLERHVERYRGPRGRLLGVDTIYFTHRGPLSLTAGRPVSMRWLVLEEGSGDALVRAQQAGSVDAWLAAMAAFRAPAQNGVVADVQGTIAIRSSGAFPIRPADGRGDYVRDGSTSASDWIGFWPVARYPFVRNPDQGFVVSANQEPKDPRVDPAYLRSNWPSPWRAMRINELLRGDSSVTVETMRRFQTDPGSARADAFLPLLLDIGGARVGAARVGGATDTRPDARRALDLLRQWDRRYTKDNERAVLFEFAMQELQDRLWDELVGPATQGVRRIATPGEAVLLGVLRDSASAWWDDRRTEGVIEHRGDIVQTSLAAALQRAVREYGDPEVPGAWRWDRVQHANIYHLLEIRSFSALDLPVQGGPSTISPSSGNGRAGPSWRMVVELGPQARGWGTYPGGQSGNPVSPRYRDRIASWLDGRLDPLRFPRSPTELAPGQTSARLTLAPAGGP